MDIGLILAIVLKNSSYQSQGLAVTDAFRSWLYSCGEGRGGLFMAVGTDQLWGGGEGRGSSRWKEDIEVYPSRCHAQVTDSLNHFRKLRVKWHPDTGMATETDGHIASPWSGLHFLGLSGALTISTSVSFDGLLVTGLYTSTPVQSAPIPAPAAFGFGVMHERQFGGTQFVCSVVASHVSHQPSTSFSFVWIAPPPGTGCVNFLATATHRGQILFKDALAQQLCEQGAHARKRVHNLMAQCHLEKMGQRALSQAWKSDTERESDQATLLRLLAESSSSHRR
ncbi:Reelin [Dissostichus eleginoides]|uniref:Reelin n=1 Tax=Dissostichus eleginoides TaxID=100907 RepID=A0AAD9BTF8_DISEL|nr:Reelin [Dissostichus eleginoides]